MKNEREMDPTMKKRQSKQKRKISEATRILRIAAAIQKRNLAGKVTNENEFNDPFGAGWRQFRGLFRRVG